MIDEITEEKQEPIIEDDEKVESFSEQFNKAKKVIFIIASIVAIFLLCTSFYDLGKESACKKSNAVLMEDGSCMFLEKGENICYKKPSVNQPQVNVQMMNISV